VIISSRSAARSAEVLSNTIASLIRRISEFLDQAKRGRFSLYVATALVVSFLGQLAIELAVFHLTTALVQGFAGYAASHLLTGAKCRSCEYRKNEANA
jgi:hypothetical protein